MKHDSIPTPKPKINSWTEDTGGPTNQRVDLAIEIMNIMEQGILVWSVDGICELHNTRVFDVLELTGDDLRIGSERPAFRQLCQDRGLVAVDDAKLADVQIRAHRPYAYDMPLPSGRVVLANARPARGGGYVVTFTDVSDARKAASDLVQAKQDAQAAEKRARDVLASERGRQDDARLLGQLDEWLQSCKSLDELFMIVTSFMQKLLPGSKGELYVYSNSRDVLDGMCHWNTRDLHPYIAPDSCWALRRGRSYEYDSEGICFTCDHVTAHQHGVDVNEYICVPVVAHGDTVGLLHIRFDHLTTTAARVTDSSKFAVRCGEHISMAIANVKLRDELHDQSIRDPLTSLYNRRYFQDAMRREIAAADKKGGSFGLISFDADRFKTFNDSHGHDAGDAVLRAIGEKLAEVMDKGAVCCRIGGEEFAVILPAADAVQTCLGAEKLRAAIGATEVRHLGGVLPRVTISAGVATFPVDGKLPQVILKRADEALYLAKAAGRNCVRQAPDAAT